MAGGACLWGGDGWGGRAGVVQVAGLFHAPATPTHRQPRSPSSPHPSARHTPAPPLYPPTQVFEFAKELAALDVFLFNFIISLDDKLGLQNLSTQRCGYVSL
jgi:hypothetical protein